MLTVPHAIASQLAPMPQDFTVAMQLARGGRALKWADIITTPDGPLEVEYGALLRGNDARTMDGAIADVRATAWQAHELARIGRADLLNPIRADRHTHRPGAGRPLTPEAQAMFDDMRAQHTERMSDAT